MHCVKGKLDSSPGPIVLGDSASSHDGAKRTYWQHLALMVSHDHLLARQWISPLLVTARLRDQRKSMSLQNGHDFVG